MIVVIVLLCFAFTGFSQVDGAKFKLPAVIENAPTAAALGRYDEIPVSIHTGVPDISIPLYTIKAGGISLPISLSYHASGIKVSDRSSTVGTGWVLNAGGVITRVVQGLADEGTNYESGEGFSKQIFPDDNDPMLQDKEKCIAAKIVDSRSRGRYQIDAQPDLFIYNLSGKSGKFIYKNRLIKGLEPGFMTIPFTPIKIVRQSNKFIITDTDGTTYIFGDDSGINFTNSNNYDYTSTTLYNADYFPPVISAWKLMTMISADKSDTISFKYSKHTYINGFNAEPSLVQQRSLTNGWFQYTLNHSPGTNNSSVTEALITEISFKKGKITFDYPTIPTLSKVHIYHEVNGVLTELKNFELFHSQFDGSPLPNAVRLDSVQETGLLNNIVGKNPPTTFTYFQYDGYEIPPYNSKGQDFWGYFNGRINNPNLLTVAAPIEGSQTPLPPVSVAIRRIPDSNYLKIGTLKTIQYPTGGTTEFDFEANQTPPTQVTRQIVTPIYDYLNASIHESVLDYVPSVQFTVDQALQLQNVPDNPGQTYNAKLHFEGNRMCTSGTTGCVYNDPSIRLIDVTNGGSFVVGTTLSGLDANTLASESRDLYVTLTTGHTYRLYFPNPVTLSTGQTYKFRLRGDIQGIRSVTLDTTETTETVRVLTGGLRIRKITSSDSTGKTLIKEYKYPGHYYNSPLFNGDYDALGLRYNYYEKWQDLPAPPHDPGGPIPSCNAVPVMKTYTESRSLPIGAASNNSLSYNEVEEYQSDGNNNFLGKTVYKFNMVQDILTASMPLYKVDKENERGLLLEKTIYKYANGIFSKVKGMVNDYINREGQPNISADTVRAYTAVGLYHFLAVDPETGRHRPDAGYLSCPIYGSRNVYRLDKLNYTSPRIVLNTSINYDYLSDDKYLVDTTYYQYTSAGHDFPTKIARTDSRKTLMEAYTKYVLDYPYSTCTSTAEQNLRQQLAVLKTSHYNAVLPVLEKYYRASVSVGPNPPSGYFPCDPLYGDSVIDTQNAYAQLKANFDNTTGTASQLVTDYIAALNTYNTCTLNYYNTASDDQKAIMELQNRNMITPELEKKEFRNGVLTSTDQTFYKIFQPNVIAQSRVLHSLLNNNLETRLRFLGYDNNGNLLEAARENDVRTVFFWGYGEQYPVARVIGADYQTARQYITQAILDDPHTTETQMRTELNKLRINLPNAQVTTYTYIPLVGMSSETDNNGRTTYYEYDPLARLKLIRDEDQNILKKIDYQFKVVPHGNGQ